MGLYNCLEGKDDHVAAACALVSNTDSGECINIRRAYGTGITVEAPSSTNNQVDAWARFTITDPGTYYCYCWYGWRQKEGSVSGRAFTIKVDGTTVYNPSVTGGATAYTYTLILESGQTATVYYRVKNTQAHNTMIFGFLTKKNV